MVNTLEPDRPSIVAEFDGTAFPWGVGESRFERGEVVQAVLQVHAC